MLNQFNQIKHNAFIDELNKIAMSEAFIARKLEPTIGRVAERLFPRPGFISKLVNKDAIRVAGDKRSVFMSEMLGDVAGRSNVRATPQTVQSARKMAERIQSMTPVQANRIVSNTGYNPASNIVAKPMQNIPMAYKSAIRSPMGVSSRFSAAPAGIASAGSLNFSAAPKPILRQPAFVQSGAA